MIRKFGKENPNWKGKVKLICRTCLKEFEVYPYQKHKAKYCSRKCFIPLWSKSKFCDKAFGWQGGISKRGRWVIRESIKLLGQNCQFCNTSEKIHTHHLDLNPCNNPLDGSNWQRLCISCHMKLHWKPRKKFASPEESLNFHRNLCNNLRKLKTIENLRALSLKEFNSPDFLRTKDLCIKMGLTRERIRQLRNSGYLKFTKLGKIFIYPLNFRIS